MTYDDFIQYSCNTSNSPRLLGITYKDTKEFLKINRIMDRLNYSFIHKLQLSMRNESFSDFFSRMYSQICQEEKSRICQEEKSPTKQELQKLTSDFKNALEPQPFIDKIINIITNKSIEDVIEKNISDKPLSEKYIYTKRPNNYNENKYHHKPMNPRYEYRPWIETNEYDISFKKIKLKPQEPQEESQEETKIEEPFKKPQEEPQEETKIEEPFKKLVISESQEETKIEEPFKKIQEEPQEETKIEEPFKKLVISEQLVKPVVSEPIITEQSIKPVVSEPIITKQSVKPVVSEPVIKQKLVYNGDKVFNPDTKRWVLVSGAVGKSVIKKYS